MTSHTFDEPVGLLRRGTVVSYDELRHIIKVKLNIATSVSNNTPVEIPAPQGLFFNNGLFVGSKPNPGTPIVVAAGSGGQYYFVSFLVENTTQIPTLKKDELLIRSNDNTTIRLDTSNNINIGSLDSKLHLSTSGNYYSSNFHNNFSFTQASRKIDGVIKRDLTINLNFDTDSKLENDNYDSKYSIISLDPSITHNSAIFGTNKNPARVEQREIIYDLEYDSDIQDDLNESNIYKDNNSNNNINYNLPNRRKSRADAFSLSLVSPNYLIETIKGTGVDIFGNILDLNRRPIPIGKDDAKLQSDNNLDKSKSFLTIKDLDRKSLAYHFEINARKDLVQDGKINLPDINSNADNARNRSRFFIDIDKEGQIKLNIPASSEKGNVPLLTRYENYSTFGIEDNNNPNKLIFREDKLDIFHDGFGAPRSIPNESGFSYRDPVEFPSKITRGSIKLVDGDLDAGPIDRITESHIKYGTAFHDILNTCFVHQNNQFLDYQNGSVKKLTINLDDIPVLKDIVSPEIRISGANANAGGRSGSFNLDGSLDLNIGANTSDRISLNMDLAGGMISNIGRDLNDRSAMVNMNGDFFIQVGGYGVQGDQRFEKQNNGNIGAILDLRVMTSGGYTHMVRIDNSGISILSPGQIKIHSKGSMVLTSDGNMSLESENMYLQGRLVQKKFGGSI